jgi:hypothetical protein
MEIPGIRTWIIYYLISFVVLLWAVFLSVQGVMLWISLMLVIIVVGMNFVTLSGELKKHAARRAMMKEISQLNEISVETIPKKLS